MSRSCRQQSSAVPADTVVVIGLLMSIASSTCRVTGSRMRRCPVIFTSVHASHPVVVEISRQIASEAAFGNPTMQFSFGAGGLGFGQITVVL